MPMKGEVGYSEKHWQEGSWPFARVYQLFEKLVLHLLATGWKMEDLDKVFGEGPKRSKTLEELLKFPKGSVPE